jgi:hypothetical protein
MSLKRTVENASNIACWPLLPAAVAAGTMGRCRAACAAPQRNAFLRQSLPVCTHMCIQAWRARRESAGHKGRLYACPNSNI